MYTWVCPCSVLLFLITFTEERGIKVINYYKYGTESLNHSSHAYLVKNWEACLIYLSGNKQVEKPLEENLIKINFAEREIMLYVTIMSM